MYSLIFRPYFNIRKSVITLCIMPLAISLLLSITTSTTGISMIGSAAAAPIATSPTISFECHKCLSSELSKIPKCDQLTRDIPALSPMETDPAVIQAYKTQNSNAVDCLCGAALQIQNNDDNWMDNCDSVCSAAVFKEKKRTLDAYSKQFSCGEPVKEKAAETPAKDPMPTPVENSSSVPVENSLPAPVKDSTPTPSKEDDSEEKDFFSDSGDDDFW